MAASQVVELRVHGVSGTPAEELLDTPHAKQVAGDNKAGFYRPRFDADHSSGLSRDDEPLRPHLEGYAWGGLTSGAPTRALWLLLLPFTLTNVAPRLRPAGPTLRPGAKRVNLYFLWLFSRLLALSMTVLLVAALAGVAVDLIGWQCFTSDGEGVANCPKASPRWLVGPLLDLPLGQRLAVGAVVPLAVLALLWQLCGRTINNYEAITSRGSTKGSAEDPAGSDVIETSLRSPWMWRNEHQVRRLRHLHLQAGLVTTLWIVTGPFTDPWDAFRDLAALGATAYVVAMLCLPTYTARHEHKALRWANRIVWTVLGALAVGIGILLVGGDPLDGVAHRGGLPGYAGTGTALFLVQLGLLGLFAVSILIMIGRGWKSQDPLAPRSLGGFSAVMIAIMGVFLGAVFSAGMYVYATAWLRTGSLRPTFGDVSDRVGRFVVPGIIREAARAYGISVAVLILVAAVLVLWFVGNQLLRGFRRILPSRLRDKLPPWFSVGSWPSGKYRAALIHDYGPFTVSHNPPRSRQVANVFWFARRVDYAHRFLAILMGLGLVITIPFASLALKSVPQWDCVRKWHDFADRTGATCGRDKFFYDWLRDGFLSARSLQGTGGYLAVMTLLLLVALGATAFRVSKTRRSVGILWDLASFWPRSAHPFAAPCYAERAVPDLVTRVHWYASDRHQSVVLSAHSQGTVLSAAALFQLQHHDEHADKPVLPRVAFLSFGCVLRRLYARYFPAYFSTTAIADVQDVLTAGDRPVRWLNLWRHSDYLGGQVTAGPPPFIGDPPGSEPVQEPNKDIEIELLDPAWGRPPGDTQYPAPSRHSNYWRDPKFHVTVARLATMLRESGETERQ